MLFIQVNDCWRGGHRGEGQRRRVGHVRIVNQLETQTDLNILRVAAAG